MVASISGQPARESGRGGRIIEGDAAVRNRDKRGNGGTGAVAGTEWRGWRLRRAIAGVAVNHLMTWGGAVPCSGARVGYFAASPSTRLRYPRVMSDEVRRILPNLITVVRLVMATAFFAIIALALSPTSAEGRQWWGNAAFILFIAAALSDILDGYLARKWGVVTDFGRVMDPFVDKVLVLGAFVYLASPKFAEPEWSRAFGIEPEPGAINCATGVASWMVVAVLARELLVTSLRGVLEARGIAFAADWSGKVKMFAQSAAIPTALFIAVNPGCLASPNYRMAQMLSVWAMTAITVWSAVPYSIRGIALLRSISKDAR